MGGRGASSGATNGKTFKNASDFEKAIGDNYNDSRAKEYGAAYLEESDYTRSLEKNLNNAISEDGYDSHEDSIRIEEDMARNELRNMPENKTPEQLGREEALKERLKVLDELKKRKGARGSGRGNVDITV